MPRIAALAPLLAFPIFAAPAAAQTRSEPIATPLVREVPDAVDRPYPGGVLRLEVDASDTVHRVYRIRETVPVAAGARALTLLYPQWRPGNHSPTGSFTQVADLHFSVGGREVAWRRDPLEPFALHLDLPAGSAAVEARFVYTAALQASEGQVLNNGTIADIQWDRLSFYPAGHYVRRIRIRPTLTLPEGWQAATALDGRSGSGARLAWAETDYQTLADSPAFAGRYFRAWDLGRGVRLDVFADEPRNLEATPAQIAAARALVDEATTLFASRHFDHYDFLLALSDNFYGIGTEHQRSSENLHPADIFRAWDRTAFDRDLLPHEFTHSWNGKFRRPARLWTPDFRQPMQPDLLWVYEGQTQLWGYVLAARSGLMPKDVVLGALARSAGYYAELPGRGWRSVEDTTADPILAYGQPRVSSSLARVQDYYREAALVWLEADQIIRAGTGGQKSLDDFAAGFFGIRDGDWGEVTYERPDVIAALNAVYPYDWDAFFAARIDRPGAPAPLAGIERGGYRLVWKDEPNPFDKARLADAKALDLFHSLGPTIDKSGTVSAVRWDSPAARAGIVNGAKIVAVGGTAYDPDLLRRAISAAKDGKSPIELLIQRGDKFATVSVPYAGGLRYPWLEKTGAGESGLDRLLAPRAQRR